jgi:membrane protease YdiL (CAAX protease family)
MGLTKFVRRRALIVGIALMYLFTWPVDLSHAGLLPFRVPFLPYLFLGWGFIAAAVLMTWWTLGPPAVRSLLRRYLMWRVGWRWYLVLLIVPALQLLGVLLNALLTRTPADFSHVMADQLRPPSFSRLAFALPFFLTDVISNGEEIGWRGYVLPRLQGRTRALTAALIVGAIWGLWHVPKFLNHWDTAYFAAFMLDTAAKSVLLTWLYNSTRGSLLLVVLAHAAWNTAGIFLPSADTLSSANLGAFAVTVALQLMAVAVIAVLAGASNLSRSEPKQVEA